MILLSFSELLYVIHSHSHNKENIDNGIRFLFFYIFTLLKID